MKILYTSSDVHKAIKKVFDNNYHRRVAVVAYIGANAESFLPSPKGIEIICCPEPGATSPASIRSLIKRGAEVKFSDELHAKIYWSEGGCVITSANISHRALGSANQKEAGILIDSDHFDIDRLICEAASYNVTQKAMDRLEMEDRKMKRTIGIKKVNKTVKCFADWYASPYKEAWKIGWWHDSDFQTAKSAKAKSTLEYNVAEPFGVLNVLRNQVAKCDWLLCFEIDGSNVSKIEWMFVDFVVPVDADDVNAYEEYYPYQAIQVHKLSQYPAPPFRLDKEFRVAFRKAAKEYGTTKIENAKRLAAPESLINMVNSYL